MPDSPVVPKSGSRRRRFWLAMLGAPLLIAACAASGLPPASLSNSSDSSGSEAPGAGGLPPECEPINLRSSTGERVVLDGQWTEVGDPNRRPLMTWWLFSQGNCIWGAGTVDDVRTGTLTRGPAEVQSLRGDIVTDFTITGEILWLGPLPPVSPFPWERYSPLEMLIEFGGAGAILLREDREAGDAGPRCPDPNYCPDPLVLERVEGN